MAQGARGGGCNLNYRGCRFLVLGMFRHAQLEARRGDIGALLWLHSDAARDWCDLAGLPWPPKVG